MQSSLMGNGLASICQRPQTVTQLTREMESYCRDRWGLEEGSCSFGMQGTCVEVSKKGIVSDVCVTSQKIFDCCLFEDHISGEFWS